MEHFPGTYVSLLDSYGRICIRCHASRCTLFVPEQGSVGSLLYFGCTWVSYSIVLWICFFIYFVEMAFSCIAHMLLSVDLLSVENFIHSRFDFFLVYGSSMVAKYWPCTFFSLMVLIFCFECFVLIVVFSCCFMDSSRTFGSIWSSWMYVSAFRWTDLAPLCACQVDDSIISFSADFCKYWLLVMIGLF